LHAPAPFPQPPAPPPIPHLHLRHAPVHLHRPPPPLRPLRDLLPQQFRAATITPASRALRRRGPPGRIVGPPAPCVPRAQEGGGGQGGRHTGRRHAAAHPLGRGHGRPAQAAH
ncbi:hypothetical protein BAE44_0010162, partial [Dichanthelium oligosanthes]